MSVSYFSVFITALFAVVVMTTGCSDNVNSKSGPVRSVVSRGPENQPIIKIEGAVPSAEGKAANAADLELARQEGYVAASDRFVQMDVLRRMARGQLSEIVGGRLKQTIPDPDTDYQTKKEEDAAYLRDAEILGAGLEEAVNNSWTRIQNEFPEVRDILLAYAEGVNRFISQMAQVKPEVARQYQMVTRDRNYRPRDWEPRDTLAVSVGVSFHLSSDLEEKLRLGIVRFLFASFTKGTEAYSKFLDLRPIENTFILGEKYQMPEGLNLRGTRKNAPNLKNWIDTIKARLSYNCIEKGFPFPSCERRAAFGSNNWVVSKAFSGTGESYLSNDPHLPLTFPNFFYEVSLDSKAAGGTIKARGVKPPGVPGILIGHNEHIGWGLTNLGADVDDVYLESFTDKNHTHYASPQGKNLPVTYKTYEVKVRTWDGNLVSRPVKVGFTEHGPIFSDLKPDLRAQLARVEGLIGHGLQLNFGLSYKWTGHAGTTEQVAVWGVNRAKDFDSFKKALNHFETGAQNFIFADTKGNIGYYSHANFPVRSYLSLDNPPYSMMQSTKAHPYEWDPKFREVVPEAYKSDGYLVTANNDPFGHSRYENLASFHDYFGFGFTDGLRAYRIETLLKEKKAARGFIDARDMQSIQTDKRDELAVHFIDLFESPKVMAALSEDVRPLAEELLAFKREGAVAAANSHSAFAFTEWLPQLMYRHFSWEQFELGDPIMELSEEELGLFKDTYTTAMKSMYRSSPTIKTLYHQTKARLNSEDEKEFKRGIEALEASLNQAQQSIKSGKAEKTTLGEVNRLAFANMLEGYLPKMFSFALQRGGSWETVDPAAAGFGPNFRMVLTLKENAPIDAKIILPGGNYNPHENVEALIRELVKWRDGDLRPMVSFN